MITCDLAVPSSYDIPLTVKPATMLSPYSGAIAVSGQTFGEPSLSFLAGGVNCSGDEPSLLSCSHTPSPVCNQYSDAGVVCQGAVGKADCIC